MRSSQAPQRRRYDWHITDRRGPRQVDRSSIVQLDSGPSVAPHDDRTA